MDPSLNIDDKSLLSLLLPLCKSLIVKIGAHLVVVVGINRHIPVFNVVTTGAHLISLHVRVSFLTILPVFLFHKR